VTLLKITITFTKTTVIKKTLITPLYFGYLDSWPRSEPTTLKKNEEDHNTEDENFSSQYLIYL